MTPRDRLALVASAVVLLLAGAWFVLVAPKRSELGEARQSLVAAQARQATAEASERSSTEHRTSAGDDMAVAAELGKAVPADDDTTSLGIQLQQLARRSDVTFQSIAVAAAAGGAGAASTTTTTTATTPAPATTTATTTSTGTAPASAASVPGAVVGPAGYTTLPLDLSFTGRYLDVQGLLQRVADLVQVHRDGDIDVRGRLLTVEGFSLTASGTARTRLQASVEGTAYLAPEDLALVAAIQGRADVALTPAPAASAPASTPATTTPATAVSAG